MDMNILQLFNDNKSRRALLLCYCRIRSMKHLEPTVWAAWNNYIVRELLFPSSFPSAFVIFFSIPFARRICDLYKAKARQLCEQGQELFLCYSRAFLRMGEAVLSTKERSWEAFCSFITDCEYKVYCHNSTDKRAAFDPFQNRHKHATGIQKVGNTYMRCRSSLLHFMRPYIYMCFGTIQQLHDTVVW